MKVVINLIGVILLIIGTVIVSNIIQESSNPSEAIWLLMIVPVLSALYPWNGEWIRVDENDRAWTRMEDGKWLLQ